MGTVFLNVLHMSLVAALMAVAVMAVRFLLNKLLPNTPKAIHCALWALVALRLILPVSVESPFSLVPEGIAHRETLESYGDSYIGDVQIIHEGVAGYEDAVEAGRKPIASTDGYYVVTDKDGSSAPKTVGNAVFPVLGWDITTPGLHFLTTAAATVLLAEVLLQLQKKPGLSFLRQLFG
jgi:hypothetical protein